MSTQTEASITSAWRAAVHPAGQARHAPGLGQRLAALAGAASFVTAWVGLGIAETDSLGVDPRTSAGALIEAYAGHTDEFRTGAVLCTAAAVLAMVFAGGLWARLRPYGEWQAMVGVAGAVALGLFWLGAAQEMRAQLTFAEYGDGEAARQLLVTGWEGGWVHLGLALLLLMLAVALSSLPTWARLASLLVAAVQASALVPGADAWLPAMLGICWAVVFSVVVAFLPSSPGQGAATKGWTG